MRLFFIVMMIIQLETTKMSFEYIPEFLKDFKKLSKKFKTLDNDLLEFKKVLNESPLGIGKHFNTIIRTENLCIIKARLFCKYLKGSSLRIIYVYLEKEQKIEFIELYFKGGKENEDRGRIKVYLNNYQD